jgi:hypothetical protein
MSQPFTPPALPHIGKVALYYGLRAGLLLGIGQSVLIIYDHYGPDTPFGALNTPVSILLWVLGFLLAGVLAARQIGKTSLGTLAGLWAGIIGGVITAGTVLFELISYAMGYGFDFGTIIGMVASTLTGLIFLVLFTMASGTGLGALGGLIGQSFFKSTLLPQYQKHEAPQQQKTE